MTQTGDAAPLPPGQPAVAGGDGQPPGGSGSAIGPAGPAVILSYIAGAALVAIIARVPGR